MIFTALPPEDFDEVETALTDAFRRAQEAARDGEPIVFVLSQEDLLGQRGAPGAILANALLSRHAHARGRRPQANAVAVGADADPEDLQHWIAQLEAGPRRRRRTRPRAAPSTWARSRYERRSSPAPRAGSARRSRTG